MVDIQLIAELFAVVAIAFIVWRMVEQNKASQVKIGVPQTRGSPLYITKAGICRLRDRIQRSPTEYIAVFDHPTGYAPLYEEREGFRSIVPLDIDQALFGTEDPVYIETDMLVKAAFNHEEAHVRNLLKQVLLGIRNDLADRRLSDQEFDQAFRDVKLIANKLLQEPPVFEQLIQQTKEAKDAEARAKSALIKERSGTEGRITRQLDKHVELLQASQRRGKSDRVEAP